MLTSPMSLRRSLLCNAGTAPGYVSEARLRLDASRKPIDVPCPVWLCTDMDHPPDSRVGLVGGSIERRIATSRIPPVDHPYVLAPFRRPDDVQALEDFVSGGSLQVEIGFGRAHHLLDLAAGNPAARILGFEIRRQWIKQAATGAQRRSLDTLRVIEGDARPFLERLIPPGTVECIHILFPDPWWKRRHHKRRVFTEAWMNLVATRLQPGGSVVVKTDVPAYADLMEQALSAHSGLVLRGTTTEDAVLGLVPRSHREKKCQVSNIPVYAFRYSKETTP